MKSILVCDDHSLYRQALTSVVLLEWPGALVLEAETFPQAWELSEQGFCLCVCDLKMPGADPVRGVQKLMQQLSGSPLLIVTGSEEDDLMLALLNEGVSGFIGKQAKADAIIAAIRVVLAGERFVSSRLMSANHTASERRARETPEYKLSVQQIRVLRLVANGFTNKEIGQRLHLAPSTIKTHLEFAMRALEASNRFEAVRLAKHHSLI